MTREWKAGDRAMVEIVEVGTGFVRVRAVNGSTYPLPDTALHPIPPQLTPEDAAVLKATEHYWRTGTCWGDVSSALRARAAALKATPAAEAETAP